MSKQLMNEAQKAFAPERTDALKDSFLWRDRRGDYHVPEQMPTGHLFFVLRMIWNHTMPESAKLHPYNRYWFGWPYGAEYFQRAIRHIGSELFKRFDLTKRMEDELLQMAKYLQEHQVLKLEEPE